MLVAAVEVYKRHFSFLYMNGKDSVFAHREMCTVCRSLSSSDIFLYPGLLCLSHVGSTLRRKRGYDSTYLTGNIQYIRSYDAPHG